MHRADPELSAALETSPERVPVVGTRLGGVDVSAQVQSWTWDTAYATDLPPAIRLASGSAAAQLSMDIGGTGGASAPALYGPWAPQGTADAARPGQSVVHGWGIAGRTVPTMRGSLRSRSAASGSDRVQLVALDGAERLRGAARLPRSARGVQANPQAGRWAASATWAVDHLLREAGIHSAPPPREGCCLYASFHGGAEANVGYLRQMSGPWANYDTPSSGGGIFDSSVLGASDASTIGIYDPVFRPVTRHGGGLWSEVWVSNLLNPAGAGRQRTVDIALGFRAPQSGSVERYYTARVDFDTGELRLYYSNTRFPEGDGSAYTFWTDPQLTTQRGNWHIGVWLEFDASGHPTFGFRVLRPDGSRFTSSLVYRDTQTVVPGELYSAGFRLGWLRAEALQISRLSAIPTGNSLSQTGQWTRGAYVGQPRCPLTILPAVSGSAWDVINEISKAVLCTAEFDAYGVFRWRGPDRWTQNPATPDVVARSQREIASLTATEEIDSVRNYCRVTFHDWSRATTVAVSRTSDATIPIPPGQTVELTWSYGDDEFDLPPPHSSHGAFVGTVVYGNAAGALVGGAVETGTYRRDGVLHLTMTNRSTATVYLSSVASTSADSVRLDAPALTPAYRPGERWWAAWNTPSIAAYGEQTYQHDPSGWIQDSDTAQGLAGILRDMARWPIPAFESVEVLADPRIQLGDVVRVVDRTGAALDTYAWVTGIRVTANGPDVRQTLSLRCVARVGPPLDRGLTPDPPVDPNIP